MMPLLIAFVFGKLQNLQPVPVRITKVECFDASSVLIPIRQRCRPVEACSTLFCHNHASGCDFSSGRSVLLVTLNPSQRANHGSSCIIPSEMTTLASRSDSAALRRALTCRRPGLSKEINCLAVTDCFEVYVPRTYATNCNPRLFRQTTYPHRTSVEELFRNITDRLPSSECAFTEEPEDIFAVIGLAEFVF